MKTRDKIQDKLDLASDFWYLEQQPHLIEQALDAAKLDVACAKIDLRNAQDRHKWLVAWAEKRYSKAGV